MSYNLLRYRPIKKYNPFYFAHIVFVISFLIAYFAPIISIIIINAYILTLGIYLIMKGVKNDMLATINYGLIIIICLMIFRFFDAKMIGFTIKGLIFMLLGISFFMVNYYMIKKRKTNQKNIAK